MLNKEVHNPERDELRRRTQQFELESTSAWRTAVAVVGGLMLGAALVFLAATFLLMLGA